MYILMSSIRFCLERRDAFFFDAVDPDDAVLDFHFVGDVV